MSRRLLLLGLTGLLLALAGCGIDKPAAKPVVPLSAGQQKQLSLAYGQLLKNHTAKSLAIYRELKKTALHNPQVLSGEAEVLLARRETPQAEKLLQEILRDYPRDGKAHILYGKLLEKQGKLREALAQFLAVPQDYADFDSALSSAAQVYLALNQPKKAQKILRRALWLYPNFDEGIYYLALSYARMGKPGLARYYLKLAASFNPEWLKEAGIDPDLRNIAQAAK